jgi:CheY-like chemotaxis protein
MSTAVGVVDSLSNTLNSRPHATDRHHVTINTLTREVALLTTLPRTLPATWPAPAHADLTHTEARSTGRPSVDEPVRVLCVDGDREGRDLLSSYFGLLGGIALETAGTLEDGAVLLAAHRPHVLLLDTEIAGRSTAPFVASIVGDECGPSIVIISADAREATVRRFRDCGVHAYQPKPVDLRQLSWVTQNLAYSAKRG